MPCTAEPLKPGPLNTWFVDCFRHWIFMALHKNWWCALKFIVIIINSNLKCNFQISFPNSKSHFLIYIAEGFWSHTALSVDWKVAISSEAANSGLTVFGHVAPSLCSFSPTTIKTQSPQLVKELQILSFVL